MQKFQTRYLVAVGSIPTQDKKFFFCIPHGISLPPTAWPSGGDVDESNAHLRVRKLALVGEIRRMSLGLVPIRFLSFSFLRAVCVAASEKDVTLRKISR